MGLANRRYDRETWSDLFTYARGSRRPVLLDPYDKSLLRCEWLFVQQDSNRDQGLSFPNPPTPLGGRSMAANSPKELQPILLKFQRRFQMSRLNIVDLVVFDRYHFEGLSVRRPKLGNQSCRRCRCSCLDDLVCTTALKSKITPGILS